MVLWFNGSSVLMVPQCAVPLSAEGSSVLIVPQFAGTPLGFMVPLC